MTISPWSLAFMRHHAELTGRKYAKRYFYWRTIYRLRNEGLTPYDAVVRYLDAPGSVAGKVS